MFSNLLLHNNNKTYRIQNTKSFTNKAQKNKTNKNKKSHYNSLMYTCGNEQRQQGSLPWKAITSTMRKTFSSCQQCSHPDCDPDEWMNTSGKQWTQHLNTEMNEHNIWSLSWMSTTSDHRAEAEWAQHQITELKLNEHNIRSHWADLLEEMPAGMRVAGVGWVLQSLQSILNHLPVRRLEPGLVWSLWRLGSDLMQSLHRVQCLGNKTNRLSGKLHSKPGLIMFIPGLRLFWNWILLQETRQAD